MTKFLRFILLSGLLLSVFLSHGQRAELRVLDGSSGKPVPFAHVKISTVGSLQSKYYVSDTAGYTGYTISVPSIIAVSYIGFKPYVDTISPGKSADIKLEPAVITFDEMVVTAQYSPVSADRSIYRINVINSMQIQKRAAYDLAGLLRNQMNVRLSQDGALGTGMSLQGLSGENVKILIDGVPVIGRLNGVIDLTQVNLQQAKQVEVIEGPMSVIYGSNALAGVINIIPKDNTGNRSSANASAYTESVGVYNFEGGIGIGRGIHGFSFQAGRNFFDGFQGVRTGREMEWKPRRQFNADMDYNLSLKKVSFKTRFSLFDELLLSKGDLLPPYFEKAFDSHFNTQRYTAKVSLQTKGCNNFSASNSYSYYRRTRSLYYNDLTILESNNVDKDTTIFGAWMSRGMYTYRGTTGLLGFQAGYDLNAEWAGGERIGGDTRSITDLAAFFSMQYQPIEKLSIQPGFRVAYNSKYNTPLIYALHIKTEPLKGASIRASWSAGFRAPSIKELYLYFVDVNHNIEGNPALKPEESKHLQVQISQKVEHAGFVVGGELNLFVNNINNIITLAESGSGTYTYINVDHYRTRGYSLMMRSSIFPSVDLRAGYGRTGKSNSFGIAGSESDFRWSPEVTSELTFRPKKTGLSFSAFYKYTGKMPRFFVDEQGLISEGQVDDYHNLDMSILKSFYHDRLTVTLGAKNLFDITSITATGTDGGIHSGGGSSVPVAWGRTFFAKINFSIWRNDKKE
ncbi:MAG: TonB-dependent receptor [Lentimicrobiaceae bacterium]|nr:TonB-dependent receptor [Lentimicrobiaceae bacterium]